MSKEYGSSHPTQNIFVDLWPVNDDRPRRWEGDAPTTAWHRVSRRKPLALLSVVKKKHKHPTLKRKTQAEGSAIKTRFRHNRGARGGVLMRAAKKAPYKTAGNGFPMISFPLSTPTTTQMMGQITIQLECNWMSTNATFGGRRLTVRIQGLSWGKK